MIILTNKQLEQKIRRLAIEIYEQNYREKSIILAGINNNGMVFAWLLKEELNKHSPIEVEITQIQLSPANPLEREVSIGLEPKALKGKVIIVADDVANTGRTVFYAMKPLLEVLPKKVEVAVIVDRKHKSFPIHVDYVGLSLATTLQEHIKVVIDKNTDWYVQVD